MNQSYLEKSKLYDNLYDEYQHRAQHVTAQRNALEAFQAVLSLFEEQVNLVKSIKIEFMLCKRTSQRFDRGIH